MCLGLNRKVIFIVFFCIQVFEVEYGVIFIFKVLGNGVISLLYQVRVNEDMNQVIIKGEVNEDRIRSCN